MRLRLRSVIRNALSMHRLCEQLSLRNSMKLRQGPVSCDSDCNRSEMWKYLCRCYFQEGRADIDRCSLDRMKLDEVTDASTRQMA